MLYSIAWNNGEEKQVIEVFEDEQLEEAVFYTGQLSFEFDHVALKDSNNNIITV